MQVLQVLVRPVVTEKSTLLQSQDRYVFEVTPAANKPMVRQAVEQAYNVTVVKVNILKNRGKMKRFGPRHVKTRDRKKAVVTLKPGDKIQIFEGA